MEPKSRARAPRDPDRQRDGLDAIGAGLAMRIPVEFDAAEGRPSRASARDGEDFSVRIAVAIARMEERQIAMQDQHRADRSAADAQHGQLVTQHGQLVTMMATFVPRSEIEATNKRISDDVVTREAVLRKDITALEERVKVIEGRAWKLIAWALGAVGSAIISLFGVRIMPGR